MARKDLLMDIGTEELSHLEVIGTLARMHLKPSKTSRAAEARAKIVYERLIDFCDDAGSKDALQFLMTREITHMKAFMVALDSMGLDPLEVGKLEPSEPMVRKYFNDSTGVGDYGDSDYRGPWNEGEDIEYIEAPANLEAQVTQQQVE